ncbi:unnamed protein product [Nippostrongylus brasiliensis]|uniref:CCHC-type domain-containing protein n=1 Tax=Nippostrongylus brasiliensis TaxID=27835 RepID=A0A0N4Y8K9_NIPBR|nr:unnamed protein product [Nippostrongylus brasiliensis]
MDHVTINELMDMEAQQRLGELREIRNDLAQMQRNIQEMMTQMNEIRKNTAEKESFAEELKKMKEFITSNSAPKVDEVTQEDLSKQIAELKDMIVHSSAMKSIQSCNTERMVIGLMKEITDMRSFVVKICASKTTKQSDAEHMIPGLAKDVADLKEWIQAMGSVSVEHRSSFEVTMANFMAEMGQIKDLMAKSITQSSLKVEARSTEMASELTADVKVFKVLNVEQPNARGARSADPGTNFIDADERRALGTKLLQELKEFIIENASAKSTRNAGCNTDPKNSRDVSTDAMGVTQLTPTKANASTITHTGLGMKNASTNTVEPLIKRRSSDGNGAEKVVPKPAEIRKPAEHPETPKNPEAKPQHCPKTKENIPVRKSPDELKSKKTERTDESRPEETEDRKRRRSEEEEIHQRKRKRVEDQRQKIKKMISVYKRFLDKQKFRRHYGSRGNERGVKCVFCGVHNDHYSDGCPEVRSAEKRRSLAASNKICLKCLHSTNGPHCQSKHRPCFYCEPFNSSEAEGHHPAFCVQPEHCESIRKKVQALQADLDSITTH